LDQASQKILEKWLCPPPKQARIAQTHHRENYQRRFRIGMDHFARERRIGARTTARNIREIFKDTARGSISTASHVVGLAVEDLYGRMKELPAFTQLDRAELPLAKTCVLTKDDRIAAGQSCG
jgi:hypothetical protein